MWTWHLILGVSITLHLIPSASLVRAVTPHSTVRNRAKVRVKLIHPKLLIQPPRHRDRNDMGAEALEPEPLAGAGQVGTVQLRLNRGYPSWCDGQHHHVHALAYLDGGLQLILHLFRLQVLFELLWWETL